mmetsp:Transcript_15021/g.22254  ORF Transcript_15021/g.22254 Transcript_15021/m.22254 type:complete len:227 (+) Transcript_15021:1293-1973(+)
MYSSYPSHTFKIRKGSNILAQQFDTEQEQSLLKRISEREILLTKSWDMNNVFHNNNNSNNNNPNTANNNGPKELIRYFLALRKSSISVVNEITKWRLQMKNDDRTKPFLIGKQNYMMKMIQDLDKFQDLSLAEHFGFEFGRKNPFLLPLQPQCKIKNCVGDGNNNNNNNGDTSTTTAKNDDFNWQIYSLHLQLPTKKNGPIYAKHNEYYYKKNKQYAVAAAGAIRI